MKLPTLLLAVLFLAPSAARSCEPDRDPCPLPQAEGSDAPAPRVDDSEMFRPLPMRYGAPAAPGAVRRQADAAPARGQAPGLDDELALDIEVVRSAPGARDEGASHLLPDLEDKHLEGAVQLPLGRGAATHVALFFGADGRLRVSLRRDWHTRLYTVPQLLAGVWHKVEDQEYLLRLREAANPWESVLVVSGPGNSGPAYPIRLDTLLLNAVSSGLTVRAGDRVYGTLVVYSDPTASRSRLYAAYFGGYAGPKVRLAVLERHPSTAWIRVDGGPAPHALSVAWERDQVLRLVVFTPDGAAGGAAR